MAPRKVTFTMHASPKWLREKLHSRCVAVWNRMFFWNKYGLKKPGDYSQCPKKYIKKNKWKKTLLEKEWGVSSFSKLQTCIQINKNTKVKKKHFIFVIQNNNKNKKHIWIKNKKDKFLKKKLKHEPSLKKQGTSPCPKVTGTH